MLTHVLLAALLLVQPWLTWPHLSSDTSHRLTLVCCLVGLGLHRMLAVVPTVRLPLSWGTWVVALLGVLIVRSWHVVVSGDYFRFFQETALFSDGLIAVLSCVWGAWALLQLPPSTFRRMRWLGVAFLLVNGLMALAEWWTSHRVEGLLGTDRLLATYAVAWVPICFTWHPALTLLPFALVVASAKPLPLLAAVFSLWPVLRGRWRWSVAVAGLVAVGYAFNVPSLAAKVSQRWETWETALRASVAHPWSGWGTSPLTVTVIRQQYGYLLPSLHSDWLSLVVQFGWLVAVGAFVLWSRLLREPARTIWARACQGSLLGIGALAAVQATVSHARIAGVMLIVLAWYMAEQRQEPLHA